MRQHRSRAPSRWAFLVCSITKRRGAFMPGREVHAGFFFFYVFFRFLHEDMHAHTRLYPSMYLYVVCVFASAHPYCMYTAGADLFVRTPCMCVYLHPYMHACMRAYVCTCLHDYRPCCRLPAYMHAYLQAGIHTDIRVYLCASLRPSIHLPIYRPTYIPAGFYP